MVEGQTYFVVHKLSVSFKYVVILSLVVLGCYKRSVTGMQLRIIRYRYRNKLHDMLYIANLQTGHTFIGMVTLSPMSVAPVCRAGDLLQITCTASVEFIKWSILQANEQGTLVEPVISGQINSMAEMPIRCHK